VMFQNVGCNQLLLLRRVVLKCQLQQGYKEISEYCMGCSNLLQRVLLNVDDKRKAAERIWVAAIGYKEFFRMWIIARLRRVMIPNVGCSNYCSYRELF
jgi:hypothetical protein